MEYTRQDITWLLAKAEDYQKRYYALENLLLRMMPLSRWLFGRKQIMDYMRKEYLGPHSCEGCEILAQERQKEQAIGINKIITRKAVEIIKNEMPDIGMEVKYDPSPQIIISDFDLYLSEQFKKVLDKVCAGLTLDEALALSIIPADIKTENQRERSVAFLAALRDKLEAMTSEEVIARNKELGIDIEAPNENSPE